MLIFVDESGDTGLKVESSSHFTLTCVVFESKEAAAACNIRIDELRCEMGLPETFRFHFAESTDANKVSFLKAVAAEHWSYWSLLVNKEKLHEPGWEDKLGFYKNASYLLLNMCRDRLDNATVTFDRTGGDDFHRKLKRFLKEKFNDKTIRISRVEAREMKKSNLVQLADMVCGAVARCYKPPRSEPHYQELISTKERQVQIWPS
jgi:hypothetical protein